MLVLTTAQKIEIVLGGAVTTNQLQFVASYIDTTDDTTGVQHGLTNDTTDVELVAAPSADLRLVRSIHVYNADTASATVTVKYDQSATERILRKASIAAGSTLVYDSQAGWYVDSPYGAQGPTGLTGATGATGSAGPQGDPGADGADGADSDVTAAGANTWTGVNDFGGATSLEVPNGAGGTTVDAAGEVCIDTTSKTVNFYDGSAERVLSPIRTMTIAVSDETTALTVGAAKVTFRAPHAMTLTQIPRASVVTAPTGSTLIVDINEGGSTIFSTELSIDATEKTSTTAGTAAVLSDTSIADDAEVTIDIVQVGSTVAGAGLKITIYYTIPA